MDGLKHAIDVTRRLELLYTNGDTGGVRQYVMKAAEKLLQSCVLKRKGDTCQRLVQSICYASGSYTIRTMLISLDFKSELITDDQFHMYTANLTPEQRCLELDLIFPVNVRALSPWAVLQWLLLTEIRHEHIRRDISEQKRTSVSLPVHARQLTSEDPIHLSVFDDIQPEQQVELDTILSLSLGDTTEDFMTGIGSLDLLP